MKFEIITSELITRSYIVTANDIHRAREQFNNGQFDELILETLEDIDIINIKNEK